MRRARSPRRAGARGTARGAPGAGGGARGDWPFETSNRRSFALTLMSLGPKQHAALSALLDLNGTAPAASVPTWKVLVLDRLAQDIIAASLRVQDLRQHGVTLHLQLHSNRPALPDVPAVYFLAPTRANIDRIAQDLRSQLYQASYINFTSALSRPLLDYFAETVAQDDTVQNVHQVRACLPDPPALTVLPRSTTSISTLSSSLLRSSPSLPR